jgi:hypothetical protein
MKDFWTRIFPVALLTGTTLVTGCAIAHKRADANQSCTQMNGKPDPHGTLLSPDSPDAQAPLAALNAAHEMRLKWSDGRTTSIALHAEQSGSGCALQHTGNDRILTYPVKLDVTTQDGRLHTELDATLWVTTESTSLPSLAVLQAKMSEPSAAEFQANTGLTGLDVAGYDTLTLRCSVYYSPHGDNMEGLVVAQGEAPDACSDNTGDSSELGCVGPDVAQLLNGMFRL